MDFEEKEETTTLSEEEKAIESETNISRKKNYSQMAIVIAIVIISMVAGFFVKGLIDTKRNTNIAITDPIKNDPNQKPPLDPIKQDPVSQNNPNNNSSVTGKTIYTVGSESITDADIEKEISKLKPPDFESRMQGLPENDQAVYRNQLRESAVKNLVNQIYFKLHLRDKKMNITEEDKEKTKTDLIDMMKKIHEQQNTGTPFDLDARLKQYGISQETFLEDITNQTIYRLVTSPILDKITATEEEAKLFFNNHPEMFNDPAKADLKHILLTSETDADAVLRELKQGADFATLAKAKSKDPQAQSNQGALGWIENDKSRVPQEILNVIFKPGVPINTPLKIQVQTQWYVMVVSGIQPEVVHTYGELADKAMFEVKENKRMKALDDFIKDLEAKYGKPVPQA